MPAQQNRYFLLTIPHHQFTPFLPDGIQYIRGQLELGTDTGYLHWQLLVASKKNATVTKIKSIFGNSCHVEPTRSAAANDYVWKDETAVENTRFELGALAFKRNSNKDWDAIWESAKRGRFEEIPADIRLRHYNSITKIAKDHMEPPALEKEVQCFWGKTGTGKSRLAWQEAGLSAYPKIPSTKFWDGYRGQTHVVIDEFTGEIGVTHLLRWLDRYPVTVENKGGGCPLLATKFWITSNIDPRLWYPTIPEEQKLALLRRMNIVHFENPFNNQ